MIYIVYISYVYFVYYVYYMCTAHLICATYTIYLVQYFFMDDIEYV